jgi:hypothetical protein
VYQPRGVGLMHTRRQPDKPTLRLGTLSCLQHFSSVLLDQRFAIDPRSPSSLTLRSLLPCGHRSLGVHRPCRTAPRRTCPDCSGPARRGTGASRGPPVPIARVQLLREAGAPRGPPVPIARVQLLRGACSSRSAALDRSSATPTWSGAPPTLPRSLGARLHGTAPPRRALIAQDMSS